MNRTRAPGIRVIRRWAAGFVLAAGILAPGLVFAQQAAIRPVTAWESPRRLQTPESVLYDATRQVLYVSCINGQPDAKDGNGFISRLSPAGRLIDLRWAAGLNAPKGMAVSANRLFVADIDALVEIDIERGQIVQRYPAAGARFLNDVAVDGAGQVYVSDSSPANSAVYRLDGPNLSLWVQGEALVEPNGLLAETAGLIVGTGDGRLLRVAYSTGRIEPLVDLSGTIERIDGIVALGGKNYLVSDWTGNVVWVNERQPALGVGKEAERWQVERILSTADRKMNAADIGFNPDQELLLVPTFMDNRVVAYRLEGLPAASEAGEGTNRAGS